MSSRRTASSSSRGTRLVAVDKAWCENILAAVAFRNVLSPLGKTASMIPLVGGIVGAGVDIAAVHLGAVWTLLVVAVSWLRYHPVAACAMLAVAGLLVLLVWMRGHSGIPTA